MGELIHLQTADIRPAQSSLSICPIDPLYRLRKNWEYFKEHRRVILPPIVIEKDNQYVSIDGHNRLTLCDLVFGIAEVFVPNNPEDYLDPGLFPHNLEEQIKRTNDLIRRTPTDLLNGYLGATKMRGINSFSDLREKYGILKVEDLKKLSEYQIFNHW